MQAAETTALWPPRPMVEACHWFARNYDPLLYARPLWFRSAIRKFLAAGDWLPG